MLVEDPLFAGVEPKSAREILVAAIEAFAARGYHATTTREIATKVGLSPAALYVHFPSKGQLLERIIRLGHQSGLEAFSQAFALDASPAARIAAAVESFTVWHAQNQTLARVVQYELDSLPHKERRAIGAVRTHFETMLCRELERGITEGEFEIEDVAGTATAIFSICIDVARWYSPRRGQTPEEIGRLYGQLAVRMITTV